jgi:hypothetical protein
MAVKKVPKLGKRHRNLPAEKRRRLEENAEQDLRLGAENIIRLPRRDEARKFRSGAGVPERGRKNRFGQKCKSRGRFAAALGQTNSGK